MAQLPFEDVQTYPRPPRLERVDLALKVSLDGVLIAETTAGWRVLETHHAPTYYFPPDDIAGGVLRTAAGGSLCEWKGRASYCDVVIGERVLPRVAWRYREPTPTFAPIAGYVAFYVGALSAWVGDTYVQPQPGSFYGGWVTPNLQGIVKGARGTEGW